MKVKEAPQKWQDNHADGPFDIIITFEERVFDLVNEGPTKLPEQYCTLCSLLYTCTPGTYCIWSVVRIWDTCREQCCCCRWCRCRAGFQQSLQLCFPAVCHRQAHCHR